LTAIRATAGPGPSGVIFSVQQEANGKFVADIDLREGPAEDWVRVVGRFGSLGDAITATQDEIGKLGN